ncbi:MAG: response regulator [Pseudazoarcus pumilus]|nr:response regulator [Pseudazoarcus pumilus]
MSETLESLPRLLIADDSRMVRASIIKQIRGRFDCREESDGEAAWETLLIDSAIEVVITDIGMPRLDGFGLIERLRSSRIPRLQKLPVIVISGDEDDQQRERARQLGANDFITKGIGTAELVARLDSLSKLGQTSRELEASREALANQSPVDPSSGLATRSYLNWRGSQDLALARRNHGGISVMVVEIDEFAALESARGPELAGLIARRLRGILANKVRHEDTVSELAPGRFAVLAPLSDMAASCAFALRLQTAIDKLVMTYREEKIRIGVSVGVASSYADGLMSLEEIIELAIQRVGGAQAAGGRRVVGKDGEVTREVVERLLRNVLSIDQLLGRLRLGDDEGLADRMPEIIAALMPLLARMEALGQVGLPLERLEALMLGREDRNNNRE